VVCACAKDKGAKPAASTHSGSAAQPNLICDRTDMDIVPGQFEKEMLTTPTRYAF
jgi:hypothetical protein